MKKNKKTADALEKTEKIKEAQVQTIEDILKRGDNFKKLEDQSEELLINAEKFFNNARAVKALEQHSRFWEYALIIIVLVIVLSILIGFPFPQALLHGCCALALVCLYDSITQKMQQEKYFPKTGDIRSEEITTTETKSILHYKNQPTTTLGGEKPPILSHAISYSSDTERPDRHSPSKSNDTNDQSFFPTLRR